MYSLRFYAINKNLKVSRMILIDQIVRYLSKDIMLPTRCYATKKQLVSTRDCCECKIFCKKPPKGSIPAVVVVKTKSTYIIK